MPASKETASDTGEAYLAEADRLLDETYEAPMDLESYVELAFERPSVASHASKYLLEAIEASGTRTVIERGEERERYRFFDDPYADGEHAVLGNTSVLNAFVDDLRSIAAGRGKTESIIWFEGPTATGKSEFKRCLVNGLRGYSKTPEGRRYTVEWNLAADRAERGLGYGEPPTDEDTWHESPVQTHPLSVFPAEVRERLVADLNDTPETGIPIQVTSRLDPFSKEAWATLEERYRDRGDGLFSAITHERHLRVKNYVMDVGQGIGVLHAEDEGSPTQRLVGEWMPEMLGVLDSRGRKNPQAFSYDGVLAQGNGGVTIVEDASQHADLLRKLLNVPEEATVKLDKGIGMDLDSQLIVISNPDLEAQLNQRADSGSYDPLKALKRRLSKREFGYLTTLSLEVQLIRRELTDDRTVWQSEPYEAVDERLSEAVWVTIDDGDQGAVERELAPHAIEAAGLFDVVTRLDVEELPEGFDLVDKALLFDRGFHSDGDERVGIDEFDLETDADDGERGVPVTYTRDVLADLLQHGRDRSHPDLPVEDVLTPTDVIDALVDRLEEAPVFSEAERRAYRDRAEPVRDHLLERQAADVLEAMLADHTVDEESVVEYIEHVYAWATDDTLENERGESVKPDPLAMKVFEVEQLGRFAEPQYANEDGDDVAEAVDAFRTTLVNDLSSAVWERRDEAFSVAEIDAEDIPTIRRLLEDRSWDDIRRVFEDFDPAQWDDPPEATETARVKARSIAHLVDELGYSRASAELASRAVLGEVADRWE